ncbi:MAG: alcohol dehydrogenase catalytic domain-containing protein [Actinomycetales bacterium]|nr:alcohol dehydrogenase catalytic domain-containing protein [Actinomycetales bacterium]
MKAGVLYAPHDLRVEDRPDPQFGDDDVLVEVTYNGLCGTDATEYGKGPMMVPLNAPHPGSGHQGPTILGHEFIGTVVDAGANVRHRIGERIACGAGVSCGECAWCRAGRTNLCAHYYTLGLSTHGGLAEYAAAPSSICVRIPDSVPDIDAALAQPLAVGMHSVDRARIQPGDTVVLLGVGAIGTFICSALRGHDGPVIAMDIDQGRLEVASTLGATGTALISPDATATDLRDLVPGGIQVVFETSGVFGSAERALSMVDMGGNVVLVGLNKSPQPLNLADVVLREVNIQTTVAHVCGSDIPAALDLLDRVHLSEILPAHPIALADVVSDGFEPLVSGSANGKIVVDPRRG